MQELLVRPDVVPGPRSDGERKPRPGVFRVGCALDYAGILEGHRRVAAAVEDQGPRAAGNVLIQNVLFRSRQAPEVLLASSQGRAGHQTACRERQGPRKHLNDQQRCRGDQEAPPHERAIGPDESADSDPGPQPGKTEHQGSRGHGNGCGGGSHRQLGGIEKCAGVLGHFTLSVSDASESDSPGMCRALGGFHLEIAGRRTAAGRSLPGCAWC